MRLAFCTHLLKDLVHQCLRATDQKLEIRPGNGKCGVVSLAAGDEIMRWLAGQDVTDINLMACALLQAGELRIESCMLSQIVLIALDNKAAFVSFHSLLHDPLEAVGNAERNHSRAQWPAELLSAERWHLVGARQGYCVTAIVSFMSLAA